MRQRNPQWGVRHLEEVANCAAGYELALIDTIELPANNVAVLFRRNARRG